MKSLNQKQWVAVFASVAILAYLFFSGPLMNLFGLSAANPNPKIMPQTGFTAQDITVGNGALAEPGSRVSAHYVGRLPNGQVFDSSRDRGAPIEFMLGAGQVIRGWDEGLVGMRAGGTRVLTIAPDYGYGARAVGPIPANSTLFFEIELVDVKK